VLSVYLQLHCCFLSFAETFGAERRPIVEFALENVEKVRLQKIWKDRRDKLREAAQDKARPLGDQSATDGPDANNRRAFNKGNKRKSHDRSSKLPYAGEGPAEDLSAAGDGGTVESMVEDKRKDQRPAKRARKSNKGTTALDGDRQDATPTADRNVSNIGPFVFRHHKIIDLDEAK
jgi:nucleolar protein 4